jgi:hypothetical protein
LLGHLLRDLGRIAEAADALTKAVSLTTDSPSRHHLEHILSTLISEPDSQRNSSTSPRDDENNKEFRTLADSAHS